jgi:hypothetical protein
MDGNELRTVPLRMRSGRFLFLSPALASIAKVGGKEAKG